MTDIDAAIRAAVLPWRKEPIYIHPSERAIWDAAFAAGAASVPMEPVAWRVWAKGGRFTRGIYENPTRETFDCWAADGDTLEPLYAAQGAKP